MVRAFAAAVLIVALLVAGCAGPTRDPRVGVLGPNDKKPAEDVAALDGVVSDENFIPIQGAVVRLAEMALETKTSWNGKFAFPQVPPDTYTLTVKAAGWRPYQESLPLKAGRAYTMTIFIEPIVGQALAPEVRLVRGTINCAFVDLGVANTEAACSNLRHQTAFPTDWAAVVTETTWKGGASSTQQAILSLNEDAAGARPYARVTSNSPARIDLLPAAVHSQAGGEVPTPSKGEKGPLAIDLRKAQARFGPLGVAVTAQESYDVYVSTFFYEAPAGLADYTALPNG